MWIRRCLRGKNWMEYIREALTYKFIAYTIAQYTLNDLKETSKLSNWVSLLCRGYFWIAFSWHSDFILRATEGLHYFLYVMSTLSISQISDLDQLIKSNKNSSWNFRCLQFLVSDAVVDSSQAGFWHGALKKTKFQAISKYLNISIEKNSVNYFILIKNTNV